MHKRHFTLLELMAAMVVLVIMMGFLFKFITSSQDLWSASERNARVYENAQIFFELVDRDLGGAMVNDVPAQEIGFWLSDPANTSNDFLAMVSAMPPLTTDEPDVCEVHYRLFVTANPSIFVLKRAVVDQKDTDTSKPWDFYGDGTTTTPPNWVTTAGAASNWQEVIDGIETIVMTCYNADGTTMTPSTNYHTLPAAVKFTITLVDQKTADTAAEIGMTGTELDDRLTPSRRQFTKVIFLAR